MTLPTMRTLREAAAESGICYNRLRLMCRQGKVVYVAAGRKFLVNMESLADYLNRGDQIGGTENESEGVGA